MNLLDKVIQEWSYKTKKGYPDINSKEDMDLFESMFGFRLLLLEKKYPFSYLNPIAKKIAKELIAKLGLEQDEIMAHSKNRIIVYTDRNRQEVFKSLQDIGYQKEQITGSSAGGFRTPEGVEIIHKAQTTIGDAGINNEKIVTRKIEERIELQGGPIDVKFVADNKTLAFTKVSKAEQKGRDSKGNKKADIILIGDKAYPISIKKDGSFRWSSASTSHREVFTKVLQSAKQGKIPQLTLVEDEQNPRLLKMINPSNNRPYGRVFIKNAPNLTIKDVAFGSDNAIIVQRSFEDEDFSFANNILTITATKIYENEDDFSEEDKPILQFERNASKATSKDPQSIIGRGITLRTVPAYFTKSGERANNLTIDYSKLD